MKRSAVLVVIGVSLWALVGCGGGGGFGAGGDDSDGSSILALDANLTVVQNSSATIDLNPGNATSLVVVQNPTYGIISVNGTTVKYRVTQPLYSGSDTFSYKVLNGTEESNEATVSVSITGVPSGTTTHLEDYAAGAYKLGGWQSYISTAGHTGASISGFSNTTHNGVAMTSRHFGVYGDNASYAGDSVYGDLFSVLPVDGAAGPMKDWPWMAELVHRPDCGADTTITAKVVGNLGQVTLGAILLNYDIATNSDGDQEMTGYHVFFNKGGGSLTLSRFNKAHELATAYIDRWPNTSYGNEAMTNPVEYGPYKGWNYRNGLWPAGGNIGTGTNWVIAVRYQYDVNTNDTTISYEARSIDGTDASPGAWDNVVVLMGADSLPTGGSFGIMGVNYHTDSMILTTDFDIAEFKAVCTLP